MPEENNTSGKAKPVPWRTLLAFIASSLIVDFVFTAIFYEWPWGPVTTNLQIVSLFAGASLVIERKRYCGTRSAPKRQLATQTTGWELKLRRSFLYEDELLSYTAMRNTSPVVVRRIIAIIPWMMAMVIAIPSENENAILQILTGWVALIGLIGYYTILSEVLPRSPREFFRQITRWGRFTAWLLFVPLKSAKRSELLTFLFLLVGVCFLIIATLTNALIRTLQ